jgi:hypothetical protein
MKGTKTAPPVHWGGAGKPVQAKAAALDRTVAPPPVHWPGGAAAAPAAQQKPAPTAPPAARWPGSGATRAASPMRRAGPGNAPIHRPPSPANAVQRAQQPGGVPYNMTNFTTMSWTQHLAAVNQGADQIGLRLHSLNQGVSTASNSTALIIPTQDISSRTDSAHALLSLQNIEQQSWDVTKRINQRLGNNQSISSDLAKQTEVVGEAAAFNVILKKYPEYTLAFAVDPGHGAGIDQLWIRTNRNTGVVEAYLIIEAKGPGASLNNNAFSVQQMSLQWVTSRIASLCNSSDATVANIAAQVQTALGQKGNGVNVPYVEGAVYTARWDTQHGRLTVSVSNKQTYN